jgi:3-methyladenine DNA glycosylase/8-oxoguanine DNA glycosylase
LRAQGHQVVVRAWQGRGGDVAVRAEPLGPAVPQTTLELAIERMRFALGVDDDLTAFYARFRADPLVGPAIRDRPWLRTARRPWPWEALAWAITEQLIESERAAAIQRRIVFRWGSEADVGTGRPLRDVPSPEAIAALAPAELQALDLSAARSLALIRAAREVACGRIDLQTAEGDRRLLAIPEIGPWTVQSLGLRGRGDPDSLPAGDLAYVKTVGRLAGLGRRATVPEVEEFFAPYEPFRGLAGAFVLSRHRRDVAAGPPLRMAA